MITAVLDTNILASGVIAERGTLAVIIDAWRAGAFTVVISSPILLELERTLEKRYFTQRLTSSQRAGILSVLTRQSLVTPVTVAVDGIATHPEDDLIVATALSGHADYLVTGDRKLQDIGAYAGHTIVSPRIFLDHLAKYVAEKGEISSSH